MHKIIAYTFLVLKAITTAFFVFIIFVFILDTYQKRWRAKRLKEEQIEERYEYTVGSWSKFKYCGAKDKRLDGLKEIRFIEHRNCEFLYADHSEFGTYSLDLDSIYVEIELDGLLKKTKRYSYELITIYEPQYPAFEFMVIASGPNCSVEFKRVK